MKYVKEVRDDQTVYFKVYTNQTFKEYLNGVWHYTSRNRPFKWQGKNGYRNEQMILNSKKELLEQMVLDKI